MIELKNTSKIVKNILINYPETRDSDEFLILKVWAVQEPNLRNEKYSFVRFARIFKEGKFTNTESIRRCRQKIQQEIPELRGKNYKKRNNNQENIKDQLKEHHMLAGGTP